MAEIPTLEEFQDIDSDRDRMISQHEERAYLQKKVTELARHLWVEVNGTPLGWQVESSKLTGPSGVFPTARITADFRAPLPRVLPSTNKVIYHEWNKPERGGWKEIIVDEEKGITLLQSSVPRADLSLELTSFPSDVIMVAPQTVRAEFEFAVAAPAKTSIRALLLAGIVIVAFLAVTTVTVRKRSGGLRL